MSSVASLVETALRNGLNIGVGVKSLSADGFSELEVRSTESEFSAPHGWYLDIERFGPLSFLKFSFDDFAKDLNELYAERLQIVKLELESSIDRLSGNGFKFSWHCGSVETTLEDLTEKPPAGKIALAATHREISEDGSPDQLIIPSVSKFLALCLLPLVPDQSPIDTSTSEGFPEGSFEIVKINRYERSSRNRLASIAFYGTHCQVCSFDFGRRYGEFASEFIHVHHIIPLSQIGPNYRIDPIKDLIPLCPNCHAVAHLKSPPYSPDELRLLLNP